MCYDNIRGELTVEDKKENQMPEEQGYMPRPAWQVWAARIGLAVFLIFLAMYYWNILRGGA